MTPYQAEIAIERPATEVFAFATDLSRQHEWSSMASGEVIGGGQPRVGALIREVMRLGPFRSEMVSRIEDYRPGRRVSYRSVSSRLFDWLGSLEVEALESGATVLRIYGSIRLRGALRLLEPLIRGELQRNEAAELERLKELLERSSTTVDTSPASLAAQPD